MQKIKLCLIGTGKMGSEYVKVVKSIKHKVKITDVLGRNLLKTKTFAIQNNIEKFHNTFENLKQIDAFIIAVSEENLFKILKRVVQYNLPTLIEKPLGINHHESKKICKLLFRKNFFFISLNRRFFNSVLEFKKKLDISKDKFCFIINDQQNLLQAKQIGKHQKVIKNYMYANSVHLLDLIKFFIKSKIINISKKIIKISKNKKIFFSKIYFKNGSFVFYICKWNIPGRWSVEAYSKKIMLSLKPLENLYFKYKNKQITLFLTKNKDDNLYKPGLKKIIDEFIYFINNKSFKQNKLTNVSEYMQTVKLIKKIYEK
jgi:predicted dehydrogenase